MESHDSDPFEMACQSLQGRWNEAARRAGIVHSFCGSQLHRMLTCSGMVNPPGSSSAHYHRRKPAFASVSLDNKYSSSKKRRKRREQDVPEQAVEPVEEEERMSRKGRRRQTKELAQAVVAEMSPEQREKWLHVAQTNKWLNKTVEFQGRKMTRRQLVKEVEDEEELQAGGAVDFTGKNKTGGAHQVPSIELRRDAPKMELRLEEEAQLPLAQSRIFLQTVGCCSSTPFDVFPLFPVPAPQDLLGRGALWSKRPLIGYAFGGLRDAGFGIYARVDQIRNTLQGRWAGLDPNKVLITEQFYQDLITHGPQTELTLMAVPSRNISLPVLRKHVEQRMTQNLKFLTEDKDDTEDKEHLTQLCNTLDGKFLANSGFVKGNNILAGTNFFFSTNKKGLFTAEAITPEKQLKDRKQVMLWQCKSPRLTYAFFAMVLGPNAVCDNAKVNIGQGALYVTNGFKFGPNPENPNQVLMGPNGEEPDSPFPVPQNFGDVQKDYKTSAFTKAFSFADDSQEPMRVLSSKRHSKREWKLQQYRGSQEEDIEIET